MILITGAKGQLGLAVAAAAAAKKIDAVCTDVQELDVTDEAAVKSFIKLHNPEAVIHCAAFTDVDGAENQELLCTKINAQAAGCVAAACEEYGAKMIYISTDYVFDGNSADFYETDSPARPLSVYGSSKLEGERLVRSLCSRHFIVRTSWLYGGTRGNFILTMLRLAKEKGIVRVVADQFGSPTYTADLARLLIDMSLTEKYGVYHATNEGFCSWYELAREALADAGSQAAVIPIRTDEYPALAKRPLNSCLSKTCLDANGFDRLPPWRDAVKRYVEALRIEII